ncbi:hypothetical protein BC828DRAFT_401748 [Blastocladiella britannica]|nr:hypothetical protein BC828DRAFT_401748 [Blastocladiella britannica]
MSSSSSSSSLSCPASPLPTPRAPIPKCRRVRSPSVTVQEPVQIILDVDIVIQADLYGLQAARHRLAAVIVPALNALIHRNNNNNVQEVVAQTLPLILPAPLAGSLMSVK